MTLDEYDKLLKEVRALVNAAIAAEREACAKVAEAYEPRCDTCPSGVANAIRARGNPLVTPRGSLGEDVNYEPVNESTARYQSYGLAGVHERPMTCDVLGDS